MTELFLYEAARAQHLAEIVRPALARGRVVVCERYTDATVAYQGHGRGLPPADIRRLNHIATEGLKPDLTVLLDVPVERGLAAARGTVKRLSKRGGPARQGDRMERESAAFHRRVRAGYLALARREPRRFCVVPWGGTVQDVHRRILDRMDRLSRAKGPRRGG